MSNAPSPITSSPIVDTFISQSPKAPNNDPFTSPLSLYPTPKSLSGSPAPNKSLTKPGPPASESAFRPMTGCATERENEATFGSPTKPEPQPKVKPRHKAKAQLNGKAQPPKAESPIKSTPRPKASQLKGKSQSKTSAQPKAVPQSKATHQCKTVSRNSRKCIISHATKNDENAPTGNGYTLLDVVAASRIVNDARGSDSNLFGLLLLSVVSELQPSWISGKRTAL